MLYLELPTKTAPTKIVHGWHLDLRARVRGLPIAQLLVVSKVFAHEYEEATMKEAVLEVCDHIKDLEATEVVKFQLPACVAKLTQVELYVMIGREYDSEDVCDGPGHLCCGIAYDIGHRLPWMIALLSHMHHSRLALVINLHIDAASQKGGLDAQQALVKRLTEHASGITTVYDGAEINVVLLRGLRGSVSDDWRYFQDREVAATWNQLSGWIAKVGQKHTPAAGYRCHRGPLRPYKMDDKAWTRFACQKPLGPSVRQCCKDFALRLRCYIVRACCTTQNVVGEWSGAKATQQSAAISNCCLHSFASPLYLRPDSQHRIVSPMHSAPYHFQSPLAPKASQVGAAHSRADHTQKPESVHG